MFKKFKKRQLSIILFYFLLILLGISILIDPVIPVKVQDVIIALLVISNIHFLNERNILFKKVKFFAQDIEKNKIEEKEKEEFISNITHDLKTPTLAQISAVKILLNEKVGILSDEQKDLLKGILSSCTYMSNLINTVLYTYKYDKGEIELDFENFNLRSILHQICLNLSELANDKNQNIILDCPKDIPSYADKLQITRVITNLISNAIKYGNHKQNILVSARCEDENVCFEVKNIYKSMKEENLNKLFEKYTTSNKESTGLGLYISKKIIEKHKGSIYVKTEGDKISFGFILPLYSQDACALMVS